MQKKLTTQSGIFTPRVLVAVALCSFGVLIAMFSLAATPPAESARVSNAGSPDSSNFLSTAGSDANRLPLGVPFPPSASESMPLASGPQGNWSIVNSPSTSTAESNRLWAGMCLSASECWAVGDHYPGNAVTTAQTLIERWDGNSWTIVGSPNPGTYDTLNGVTCVSASDCWAVGNYLTPAPSYLTLTEHWDGSSWSIVPSPNVSGSSNNFLYSVTCVSTSDCWAVGYASNGNTIGSGYDTLIERWNGISWAIVSSPNTGIGQSNRLLGVTCASASECWAVGYYYTGSDADARTLIERWDGTSWAIVNSPNALTAQNFLTGVTCVSGSDCWAVGYTNNAGIGASHQTLIERWDGTSWAIVSSANTSTAQGNWLTGVTCASASECWAVGYYVGSTYQNLIERWDGTSWAVVASPNKGSSLNLLYGVTCAPASDCWALGVYSTGSAWQTLTLKYSAVLPIPLSIVSRKTHGAAGDFDIDLPLAGAPGIECRSGGANGNYQVIVTFPRSVTFSSAAVAPGPGGTASVSSASSSPDGTLITVNLTNVSNAQKATITLAGVSDGTTSGDVSVSMGLLLGDVNASERVDGSDLTSLRQQSLKPVTSSNFRNDVNATGRIDGRDGTLVAPEAEALRTLP